MADEELAQWKAVKTGDEIVAIRKIRGRCMHGFRTRERRGAGRSMHEGRRRGTLRWTRFLHVGHTFRRAYGAFARSTVKRVETGDLVLTHCNSQVNGYWTDITRTFSTGELNERKRNMDGAVFEAREAAMAALKPGVSSCDVDHAARRVLEARGFGKQFRHSTWHGVGFSAIDALAVPRLHPQSPDRIEPGMVFNVEPAGYFEDFGGLRHCEIVVMKESGAEILTPFLSSLKDLGM